MKIYRILLMTLTLLFAVSNAVIVSAGWAESNTAYTLRTNDGLDADVTIVNSPFTFKMASPQGWRDAGVVFLPANPGEVVTMTVKSCSLDGSTNYLLVYDGKIERIESGVSDGVDQSRYLPAGWKVKVSKDNVGATYMSTDASGALSFGYHSGTINGQNFEVTVESVVPKDMEYKSTVADSEYAAPRRGQTAATLGILDVVTEGVKSPLTLNSMTIDCGSLDDAVISSVCLYKSMPFTDANLVATMTGRTLNVSDITLGGGHNRFYVVGDVASDATGSVGGFTVTSVNVGGTAQSTSGIITPVKQIANTIYMPASGGVYTISGDTPFYDDGGPDGKISEKFNGQITFVPATPGHSIKVDFNSLNIFHTSSTGLNDKFEFYNGHIADEANLIRTLLDEPRTVKSTAADGSMTVVLTSKTGVPADGWDAVVREFLPGNMTLKSATASDPWNDATFSSGDTGIRFALIDIVTDNTSQPLSLGNVNLSVDNPTALTGFSLYSLGEKSDAALTTPVATATSLASVTLNGNVELGEGHNYFVVTADAATLLAEGAAVEVKLNSFVVGGATQTSGLAATRRVHNLCRLTEGSHSHTITGTWEFLPEMNTISTYAERYATGQADRTVTFTPTDPNSVIQIEFSKFDLYYSTSSYSPKAKFEIYSGTECNAANLIWQLDDVAKKNVGPGEILRAKAADGGSMTIRFNPNTTSSSYTATGWQAVVKEFQNHDMSIIGVETRQTSTAPVSVGGANAPMIDFTVITEGTLSTKTIAGVTLDLTGHEAISKVRVYYSDKAERPDAKLFGEADAAASVTVSGNAPQVENRNYWWVEIDIKADAEPETAVDVALRSLTDTAGKTDAVTDGNPEGSRTVKLQLVMEDGTHVINVSRDMRFYDDGGDEGKIGSVIGTSKTVVYTFIPTADDSAISVNANSFSIGNGRMYVYSGREVNEANLLGTITGYSTTNGPENLVSKAVDGSLTISVKTPTGKTLDGFDMTVGVHKKQSYSLGMVAVDKEAVPATMVRGARQVPLMRIDMTVDGDKGASKAGNFSFDLGGTTALSDISALKLYWAGSTTMFNENIMPELAIVAPASTTVSLNADREIGDRGVFSFFLVADISGDAAVDNIVSACLTSVEFNGETKNLETDASALKLTAGLKGEFTVGADGDYATIKDAVAALSGGVEGPVTFKLKEGNYTEQVAIANVSGTSEQSPVVITSLDGDRDKVTIKPAYSASVKDAVSVTATPWVTFRALTIDGSAGAFTNVVNVVDRSHHFTMDNCVVKGMTVTGSSGTSLLRTTAGSAAGCNNDYLTVRNSSFDNGFIALYISGAGNVAYPRQIASVIEGNTIAEARSKGVYLTDIDNAVVDRNVITQSTTTKNDYYAVDAYRTSALKLTSNKIVNTHNKYSTGLYLRDKARVSAGRSLVANNDIVITNHAQYGYGVLLTSGYSDADILFNTVRTKGTGGYMLAVSGNYDVKDVKVAGNLFAFECDESVAAPIAVYFAYKDLYDVAIAGNTFSMPNGKLMKHNSDMITTLDDFNVVFGQDAANRLETPTFVGDTDQHLLESGDLRTAKWNELVPADRDGRNRSHLIPTFGAYEYVDLSAEVPAIADGYPTVGSITENSADVRTKWTTGGRLYAKTVEWSDEAATPSAADILACEPVEIYNDTEITTRLNGLTPTTTYRTFFITVSPVSVESDVVATKPFTTLRHIDPLTLAVDPESTRVDAGGEVVLTAYPAGGDEPYTYEWRDMMGQIVSTEATAKATLNSAARFGLSVRSADGQSASANAVVYVTGDMVAATADDNAIAENSYIAPTTDGTPLISGTFAFNGLTQFYGTSSYWNGYAFSASTSSAFNAIDPDQYNSVTGSGYESTNFIVAYPAGFDRDYEVDVTNNPDGDIVPGVYLTNSAYTYSSMMNGDSFAKKFVKGDWFKLTIIGVAADESEKSVDFYLADMRDENEAEHYIVNQWEWLDLSSLGAVVKLKFTFDSTDKAYGYLNTPTYACIDNLGGERGMLHKETVVGYGERIDLTQFFDDAPEGVKVSYTIETPDEDAPELILDGDNVEIVDDTYDELQFNMVIGRTVKGHTEFADIDVTRQAREESLQSVSTTAVVKLYPVPVTDHLNIATALETYSVAIYGTDGSMIVSRDSLSGNTVIERGSMPAGVYIVRIMSEGRNVAVSRIVVL